MVLIHLRLIFVDIDTQQDVVQQDGVVLIINIHMEKTKEEKFAIQYLDYGGTLEQFPNKHKR